MKAISKIIKEMEKAVLHLQTEKFMRAILRKIGVRVLASIVIRMIYVDDSKYVGEFKNNRMNGRGKLIDKNGNVTEGYWKDDVLQIN